MRPLCLTVNNDCFALQLMLIYIYIYVYIYFLLFVFVNDPAEFPCKGGQRACAAGAASLSESMLACWRAL